MVETIVAVHSVASLGDVSLAEFKVPICNSTGSVERDDRDPMPPGVGPTIDLLSSGSAVYWIGEASFDTAVERLWNVLGPTDRANLVFGLLFSPTSIPYPIGAGSIALFLVPDVLRSRFEDAKVIDADRPPAPGATARAVLNGDTTLAEQLGITKPSLNQWRMLTVVQGYLDRVESLGPDEVRSCAHLLGSLTAVADDGLDTKKRIGARLKAVSPNASFSHISACRNLPFDRLPRLTLVGIVDLWTHEVFSDPNRLNDLGAAIASIETGGSSEFENALRYSLRGGCLAVADNIVEHLQAAIVLGDQRSFSWLVDTTQSSIIDSSLAGTVGPGSAAWLHDEAQRHAMPETHAASCPNDDPLKAWEAHLGIVGHTAESRGRLASRCKPGQLVDAALHLGDRHLVGFAGAAAIVIPEALEPARPLNRNWRAVLASATAQGADPWTWMESEDVEPMLSAFLDGETNLIPLVEALSANDTFHVLDFPRRSQVWTALNEPPRTSLLQRTALVATMRGVTSDAMESPLIAACCSSANLGAAATRDINRAIDTLEALAQFCTAESAVAIARATALDGSSQRFGRIVAANRWTEAARFLATNATRRADLRPAAHACRHLLSGWERFKLTHGAGEIHPTSTEFSDGLLDVATTLYPIGPQDEELWERSGGNPADIPTSGTGRDQWTKAIRAIIDGATGAPSMKDLIDTMIDDYGGNQRLKKLRKVL